MNRRGVPLSVAVVVALLTGGGGAALGATAARAGRPAPSDPSTPVAALPSVTVLQLPFSDSGGPREAWVYRPPGVPDSPTLPVLYLLHGYPDTPASVFGSLQAQRSLAAFAHAGGAPFVLVAPDGRGSTHADSEWADSVDGADRIETFLVSVVIPAVEGGNRRDAAHRAIAGYSMGGYGAVNIALRHPDLFGPVAALAGYFHVDDPDGVFGRRPATEAANDPDQHVAAARGHPVLLSDGSADAEPLTRGETQRFAARLRAADVPVTVDIVTGGQHDSAYVRAELPRLWRFLDASW